MTTFDVRGNNDPQALPLGDVIISTGHATYAEAQMAIDAELRAFGQTTYGRTGRLARIIIEVDDDGAERVAVQDADEARMQEETRRRAEDEYLDTLRNAR